MSASYVMEKYQPPKNQAPSKVRRFPLYRRPVPKPVPTAPPADDPPKEEKPAPPPSNWSNWQFIKETLWEGYWRASPQEDGGWHYHFTKDGKTIWEQKVPKPEAPPAEAPKPSKSSAKTDGALSEKTPTTAFTSAHIMSRAPSLRATTTADDGINHPSSNDIVHSTRLYDIRALTLRGYSSSEASATVRAQEVSSISASHQRRPAQRQDGGIGTGNSSKDRKNINDNDDRDHYRDRPVLYSEEARTSQTASATQEGRRDYHVAHKKRQGRHRAVARSREAGSHQNTIGEVVSAEKKKQFDAKKIVDGWQWG
ncbi:hypothetical protein N0V93_006324 [Gnomoniopsis smithogilvyi]|uniref:Uncharacterized protein n=1 Tax=Gnomoniopsis smithogilvyi TaxID=1191159 RepID=A0A9W9CUD8_9PEZI|nr:hypothetical protein N0V93_006324 [Gnomoniopsis smithogilvyi]